MRRQRTYHAEAPGNIFHFVSCILDFGFGVIFYKYGVSSKHFFGNIFQKPHFLSFFTSMVLYPNISLEIFFKKRTFLRNIDCFMCFKNIHASCLRGGRRNLPNCPGPSPSRPGTKITRAGKPLTPMY